MSELRTAQFPIFIIALIASKIRSHSFKRILARERARFCITFKQFSFREISNITRSGKFNDIRMCFGRKRVNDTVHMR